MVCWLERYLVRLNSIPVERRPDVIFWHFEGRLDDLLLVLEIKAVQREWYQTLDLNELQSAPILLGWSEQGSLLLGTEQVSHNMPWSSEARNAHLMKLSKPTFQASFKILAQLSIATSATIASVDIDIIHPLPESYAQRLLLCTRKPWIVYNDVQKRALLVPAIPCTAFQSSRIKTSTPGNSLSKKNQYSGRISPIAIIL